MEQFRAPRGVFFLSFFFFHRGESGKIRINLDAVCVCGYSRDLISVPAASLLRVVYAIFSIVIKRL